MYSGCHLSDVFLLIHTGASCNYNVYSIGTSGLVKGQYATICNVRFCKTLFEREELLLITKLEVLGVLLYMISYIFY